MLLFTEWLRERTGSCKGNEFSSVCLTGLIHTKPTGAQAREKKEEEVLGQHGRNGIPRGTGNPEPLEQIAEEVYGLVYYVVTKMGAFWPSFTEEKV